MSSVRVSNALELYYVDEETERLVSSTGDEGGEETTTIEGQRSTLQLGRLYRVAGTLLVLLLIVVCVGIVRNMDEKMSVADVYDKNTSNVIEFPLKRNKSSAQSSVVPRHERGETDQVVYLEANGRVYNVSKQAAKQIENYRRGTGLILNLHMTHHGGTTICSTIGRSPDAIGRAPGFACNTESSMKSLTNYSWRQDAPWRRNETSTRIASIRKHYHMIGWEYGFFSAVPDPSLSETEWENPNLFSILVMRDPISRLLAADGWKRDNIPGLHFGNASKDDWWTYAKHPILTNNYALRVLGGPRGECCNGSHTDPRYLEAAKALVERFSVVLDIECLTEGIEAIGSFLNITLANQHVLHRKKYHRPPSRERIGYDDVYNYLLEKNRLDIELYEWSKSRALINCTMSRESTED